MLACMSHRRGALEVPSVSLLSNPLVNGPASFASRHHRSPEPMRVHFDARKPES